MRGLIYKDLVINRKDLFCLFCTLVFFGVIAFIIPADILSFMYAMLTFLFLAGLPVMLFAYVERKDWDAFICATPLSKKKIVGAKYVMYFLTMPAFLLFTIPSFWFFMNSTSLSLLLTFVFCAVILAMIQFPILYQFGTKFGRFISMFMVYLLTSLFMQLYLGGVNPLDFINEASLQRMPYYTGLAALVLTFLSYRLSLTIYRNKER